MRFVLGFFAKAFVLLSLDPLEQLLDRGLLLADAGLQP
jgi:hypothetical protein